MDRNYYTSRTSDRRTYGCSHQPNLVIDIQNNTKQRPVFLLQGRSIPYFFLGKKTWVALVYRILICWFNRGSSSSVRWRSIGPWRNVYMSRLLYLDRRHRFLGRYNYYSSCLASEIWDVDDMWIRACTVTGDGLDFWVYLVLNDPGIMTHEVHLWNSANVHLPFLSEKKLSKSDKYGWFWIGMG